MKQKIVAGNWKMNKTLEEGISLCEAIVKNNRDAGNVLVLLAVPYIHLSACAKITEPSGNIFIAAQNCSQHKQGAFTGEVSAEMIFSTGAKYVLIGHSERRQCFNETSEQLLEKIKQALEAGLTPVYCCGETLAQRQAGQHLETIRQQITEVLFDLSEGDFGKVIIAYEPVWAIGSGHTATPSQAQDIHLFIRTLIRKKFGQDSADNASILYGGSCNPLNASSLFSEKDIDGGLIGGASLKQEDFISIIKAAVNELH